MPKKKKSFHPVRQFRLSDETYGWLLGLKKGTWEYTFNKMRYGKNKSAVNGGATKEARKERPEA